MSRVRGGRILRREPRKLQLIKTPSKKLRRSSTISDNPLSFPESSKNDVAVLTDNDQDMTDLPLQNVRQDDIVETVEGAGHTPKRRRPIVKDQEAARRIMSQSRYLNRMGNDRPSNGRDRDQRAQGWDFSEGLAEMLQSVTLEEIGSKDEHSSSPQKSKPGTGPQCARHRTPDTLTQHIENSNASRSGADQGSPDELEYVYDIFVQGMPVLGDVTPLSGKDVDKVGVLVISDDEIPPWDQLEDFDQSGSEWASEEDENGEVIGLPDTCEG